MAVTARYVQPLQVLVSQETRDRIMAIADREGISQAAVVRDLIDAALENREAVSSSR